jgi:molybdopterin-guanine dinucleotide biosynthesis protein A
MTERVGAVVLAGGRSSRFGRDKLAEPLDGRPLLEHAVEAVRSVATDVFVVVAPGADPALPPGVQLASDQDAHEGPLAGLAAGLAALDPAVERVVAVGGDMPTLVPAVLGALLDALERRQAAVLADAGGPRPLPLAIRRSSGGPAAARLLESGERRVRALLEELDVQVLEPSTWRVLDPGGSTLRDVDVPDDLAR